ncbi:LysM peptidoglycan-binding domain-containing protein [Candidatus Nomurabacteria bacterium]|nr:LysM peptidoglycan-binding domain-containing protein [Candidatus Nomurabacteria bacterium]
MVGYTISFCFLIAVVAIGYQPPQSVSGQVNSQVANTPAPTVAAESANPSVDNLIATDITASLSEQVNLPIAANAANMSVSLAAKSELAQTDDTVIAKPQIVQPEATNRAISTYVAVKGDTVQSVAKKMGLSENTIRWANNLERDSIEKGKKLVILPVDGLRHKMKSGETVNELAERFDTSPAKIIAYNDLEISRPKVGQYLIIPDGDKPEATAGSPQYTAGATAPNTGGVVVNAGMARASAGNRYAPGNCTWYAYERSKQLGRTIGSFWGNANTWAVSARAAGFTVNGTPAPSAILVDTAGYYGHVAVVESVKPNGDIVISEMNNYAYGGFNVVNSRTISAGQARGYQYVH